MILLEQLLKVNEKLGKKKELKILRLYGRTHERKDYPDPIMEVMNVHTDEKVDSICPKKFAPYALHHKIREGNSVLKRMENDIRHEVYKNKIIPSTKERKE